MAGGAISELCPRANPAFYTSLSPAGRSLALSTSFWGWGRSTPGLFTKPKLLQLLPVHASQAGELLLDSKAAIAFRQTLGKSPGTKISRSATAKSPPFPLEV